MSESEQGKHSYYEDYTDTPDDHLVEGFDPEVALDLGIPVDHDSLTSHVESAQQVQKALSKAAVDGAAEHAAVVEAEGPVICANCNTPGCLGCGRS